jgi:enoyl-CoA hydratase/carnithine racemase
MTDAVLLEHPAEHVALLRLNRPPRNVMSPELLDAFSRTLARATADPTVRALVITGGSLEPGRGQHFCAGADLGTDALPGVAQPLGGAPGSAEQLRDVYAPFLGLLDVAIPTVAAVNGAAVGGGFGLACVCDFRVATPESRFKAPFATLGVHPGMALTSLLPALVGLPRAMELLLLAEEVSGLKALEWGLVHRCVPASELEAEAITLASRLAAAAPAVVRWTKRAVHRAISFDPKAAADVEALAQALTFLGSDAAEGIAAFRERRAPRFEGR